MHSYIDDSRYWEIWAHWALIFRTRGPLVHLGADPPNNNELFNAVPKYEEIGQYWSKRDIIEYE